MQGKKNLRYFSRISYNLLMDSWKGDSRPPGLEMAKVRYTNQNIHLQLNFAHLFVFSREFHQSLRWVFCTFVVLHNYVEYTTAFIGVSLEEMELLPRSNIEQVGCI